MLTRSQEKMAEILSLLTEISKSKDKKPDEQPDNIDILNQKLKNLLNKKKAKRKRIKNTYTKSSMSRSPITLAQLKARNNSEKT